MKLTKEKEIEGACAIFCHALAKSTMTMMRTNTDLSVAERKAFGTGMLAAIDSIKSTLLPTLQEIVKENPKSFENLN